MNSVVGKLAKLSLRNFNKIAVFQNCENFKELLLEGEDSQLEDLEIHLDRNSCVMVVEEFSVEVKQVYFPLRSPKLKKRSR